MDLPGPLLAKAKRIAAERGASVSAVLSDALRAYLGSVPSASDAPFELIVRGRAGARMPTPREMLEAEEADEVAALRVPRVRRRAAS